MGVARGGTAVDLGNQRTITVVAVGASLPAGRIVLNAIERVVVVAGCAVALEIASIVVCPAIDLVGSVVCTPVVGAVACQVIAVDELVGRRAAFLCAQQPVQAIVAVANRASGTATRTEWHAHDITKCKCEDVGDPSLAATSTSAGATNAGPLGLA